MYPFIIIIIYVGAWTCYNQKSYAKGIYING